MRIVWAAALGAGAMLLAGCQTPTGVAAARPRAAAAAKPQQQATGDLQSGKICKSVETTGSRFSTRECHTAAEWAQIGAQGADDMFLQDTPHSLNSGR